jgi:hypothetical protein
MTVRVPSAAMRTSAPVPASVTHTARAASTATAVGAASPDATVETVPFAATRRTRPPSRSAT